MGCWQRDGRRGRDVHSAGVARDLLEDHAQEQLLRDLLLVPETIASSICLQRHDLARVSTLTRSNNFTPVLLECTIRARPSLLSCPLPRPLL